MAVDTSKHTEEVSSHSTEHWFDVGVNLTNGQFSEDFAEQIALAAQAGVTHMCITGTNERESLLAAEMAAGHSNLYSTAGVHPHDAKEVSTDYLDILKSLYQSNANVKAIGECGLDFNRNYSPQDTQVKIFAEQLDLAAELNAPLFLHQRDAHDTFIQMLRAKRAQLKQIVVHCFTGTHAELQDYLELDCYIGITGWICDERRGLDVLDLVKHIPEDKLLIETDAPFLLPRNLKPKPKSRRNLPLYLPHIAQQVATQKQMKLADISHLTFANSQRFFNLSGQDN